MTDTINNGVPNPVMIYGRAPNGQLQAVTTDGNGNISFTGSGANPVQSGLIAEYRMLATETPASLVDYSGNGNNAVGTVGTAPSIIANSGGISCPSAGAVILPSALNGAKSIFVMASKTFSAGNYAPFFSNNGGSGTTGGVGLAIIKFSGNSTIGPTGNNGQLQTISNNTSKATQKAFFGGTGVLGMVMDTADRIYLNGKEEQNYYGGAPGASVGTNASQYQLCGSATGNNNSLYWGANGSAENIYFADFYNRVVTPTEAAEISQYMLNTMSARGVTAILAGQTINGISVGMAVANGNHLTCDGDSTTVIVNLTTSWCAQMILNNGTWDITNSGLLGEGLIITPGSGVNSNFVLNADYGVDTTFRPGALNVDLLWGGTNDVVGGGNTAAAVVQATSQYVKARHKVGWIVGIATPMDRTSSSTFEESLQQALRSNWNTSIGADFFIDVGGTTQLGCSGCNASTTWFQVDGIHENQNGASNLLAFLFARGVNRYLGNTSFTTANTYVSAAAAAVTTTGATESGNTVTITFASGNTCLAGMLCTCTGITPTGYNQTYYVQTSSSTQFTAYNPTGSLGAQTVAGSCSAPQQVDADQYIILNYGTGSFTLQPCAGLPPGPAGRIYIKNINATSSTVTAFPGSSGSTSTWAAETIDGSATATVVQNATLILEPTIVSNTAGGCKWTKIQNA